MTLFQRGNFTFNSGRKSNWKIECDDLNSQDIETLVWHAIEKIGQFSEVVPVPKGKSNSPIDNAERMAVALRPHAVPQNPFLPILIVDDVYTTGGSIERAKLEVQRVTNRSIRGLVLFAYIKPAPWINAVWIEGL